MSNDKENFVCLSCYFVGELDVHGRCSRCNAEGTISVHTLRAMDTAQLTTAMETHQAKPLKWWHFVCGPFETYISNYRVTNLEEARHEVYHDNFFWTAKGDVFVEDFVEELSAEEYEVQWRQGNARKSEYYQTPNIEVISTQEQTKEVVNDEHEVASQSEETHS